MADPGLQFDRATYTTGESRTPCANCKRALVDEYWEWQGHMLCPSCRDGVATTLERTKSGASFGKAILLGGAAALGCGIAYAVFVGLTKMQLALATIGIAYVIARVVRKVSGGLGGRRFQVLAVVLTYVASAMGYFPAILGALSHPDDTAPSAEVAPSAGAAQGDGDAPATGRPEEPVAPASGGPLKLVIGLALLFGLTLAAPFFGITEAPIGALIVLFGLWEAWKLSRGVPVRILGPFRVAPTPSLPGA